MNRFGRSLLALGIVLAGTIVAGTHKGSADADDPIQYVSSNGNDKNEGSSWAKATATVIGAYSALTVSGGVVILSPGRFLLSPTLSVSKAQRQDNAYRALRDDAGNCRANWRCLCHSGSRF